MTWPAGLQVAHCSLSFLVCAVGVCLSERRGAVWSPGGPLAEPVRVSVWVGKRAVGCSLCLSGPAGGAGAQGLVWGACHSSHFLCHCG